MKIAFLSFYSGSIDRGVEVATAALAKQLSKKHDVVVFQTGKRIWPHVKTIRLPIDNSWPEDTSSSLSRLLYLDYYSRKITLFSLKFVSFFLRVRYDVVIPTNGGWQVVICRIISWILHKKMIVQGNAGIGRDDFWNLLTVPNRFIAISPQGFAWANKKAPWIKNRYIPYGVDLTIFQKATPARLALKKPIILCVSAFVPFKRIDRLIRAMKLVPEASLLVIGQGPLENDLRKMGKQILKARFQLLTGITHDKLPQYYKVAKVFSLPSESSEALGIVQIEALAAGLPVVATDDMNRREIIGNAGILVDPNDHIKYAAALQDSLQKDFGNTPQKHAAPFSWEKIGLQYESLLSEL